MNHYIRLAKSTTIVQEQLTFNLFILLSAPTCSPRSQKNSPNISRTKLKSIMDSREDLQTNFSSLLVMISLTILCLTPPASICFLVQYLIPDTPAVILFILGLLGLLSWYKLLGVLIKLICFSAVVEPAGGQTSMPLQIIHVSFAREMRECELGSEEAGVRRDAESDEEDKEVRKDSDSGLDCLQHEAVVSE